MLPTDRPLITEHIFLATNPDGDAIKKLPQQKYTKILLKKIYKDIISHTMY